MAVLAIPGGFLGVGAFYFASILYAVCTYWFGGWGLIASFIGAFVGSGLLTGMPVVFALPFAIADIWEPLIPFLFLRLIGPRIGLDPLGSNILSKPWYKFALFILFGAIIPPFISGLWGTWILNLAGFIPAGAFWVAVLNWWLGAFILLIIFVPQICKGLSGFLRGSGLACKGIWS
jgi:integral membrane sensor domain MASE1